MLIVSLANVLRVNLGFNPSGVLAADLRLPQSRYDGLPRQTQFFEALFERLSAVPGVHQTCATNTVPLETTGTMTYVPDGTETLVGALPVTASPGCFATLGIALRRGRFFDARDREPVAVVSEGFARKAFPNSDALGRRIRIGLPSGEPLTIIGIVADSRQLSVELTPYAQVYQPTHQSTYFRPTRVLLRVSGPVDAAAAALRQAVRDLDAVQPVGNIRMLDDVVTRSIGSRRFNLSLLGTFAGIALLLAGIGVYGLLAQLVAQRRAEIGVRMALGARPERIVRLVTGGALMAVCAGVLLGLGGAWVGARLIGRFVFGVSPTDPALYAASAGLLGLVAGLGHTCRSGVPPASIQSRSYEQSETNVRCRTDGT